MYHLDYDGNECEYCPTCGEDIYVGMMDRHMAKDHNPDDAVLMYNIDRSSRLIYTAALRVGYNLTRGESLRVADYLCGLVSQI